MWLWRLKVGPLATLLTCGSKGNLSEGTVLNFMWKCQTGQRRCCVRLAFSFFLFLVFTIWISIWFKTAEYPWSSATTDPRTDSRNLQQHPNPEVNTPCTLLSRTKDEKNRALVYVFQILKSKLLKLLYLMLIWWEGLKNSGWGKIVTKLKIFENHKVKSLFGVHQIRRNIF